ncbi:hypothetical protein [Cyclobacterium sp. SYSU L10401]|uniref:hypothetical protein n=1 Tax=Cyclobacterium sp. SYSU L10401 TaxID=2678657 RepID=UPI0013D69614|nr:hypothetical protein [Cyclobacterium sp. SYSU L10401]
MSGVEMQVVPARGNRDAVVRNSLRWFDRHIVASLRLLPQLGFATKRYSLGGRRFV